VSSTLPSDLRGWFLIDAAILILAGDFTVKVFGFDGNVTNYWSISL